MRKRLTLGALTFVLFFFVLHSLSTLAAQNLAYETVLLDGQTFYKYSVKSGEGLYAVSRVFSVSVDDLLKYNPSAKNGLKSGQELLIPVQPLSKGPQSVSLRQKPLGDDDDTFRHTVSRGETVFSIAQMYLTTSDEIYKLNPGAKEKIIDGQVLVIPQRKTISRVKEENYRYHTISAGETLYAVSKTYKLKPEDVVAANPGLSAETFQTGKTIRIPFFESNETFSSERQADRNVQHLVGRRETLYNIARKYNVPQDDIRRANPALQNGKLKEGMTLAIPTNAGAKKEEDRNMLAEKNKADLLLSQPKPSPGVDKIKIGLLLPFLDKSDNNNLRMQEYYEGFLLALLKMKNERTNAELITFDIGSLQNTKKLESLLGTMEMQSLNLIIGGFSDKQIKIISDFAKAYNIKYVIPFPTKSEEILNNGNIFQVITPQSYFYNKASNVFMQTFKKSNVIIASAPGKTDKKDFIDILKSDLQRNKINFSTVEINQDFSANALPVLSSTQNNIIVPTSGESSSLQLILDGLKKIQFDHPEYATHLFGYPEWQTYGSSFREDYHLFGTYFYSYFYVDENSSAVRNFNSDFRTWYKRGLMNTYPKYGMLGYDTALFFLTALKRNGINFEEKIDAVRAETLQFAFHFERVNNWGGFINTGLYLVYYEAGSNNVIKLEKSR